MEIIKHCDIGIKSDVERIQHYLQKMEWSLFYGTLGSIEPNKINASNIHEVVKVWKLNLEEKIEHDDKEGIYRDYMTDYMHPLWQATIPYFVYMVAECYLYGLLSRENAREKLDEGFKEYNKVFEELGILSN